MDIAEALEIKRRAQTTLSQIPGVRYVSLGFKVMGGVRSQSLSVRAFVAEKLPLAAIPAGQLVPSDFEGLATDVEAWGETSLLDGASAIAEGDDPLADAEDPQRRRHSPLIGGIQIANVRSEIYRDTSAEGSPIAKGINASQGTLGCFVRTTGAAPVRICALTNHHVTNPAHTQVGNLSPDLAPGRVLYQPAPFIGPGNRPKPDAEAPPEGDCSCSCASQQEQRRMGRVLRAKNSEKVDAALVALKGGTTFQQQLFDLQGLLGPEKGLVPIMGSRKKPAATPENPNPTVYVLGEVVFKLGYRTSTTRGVVSDVDVTPTDATLDAELGPYRAAPVNAFLITPANLEDPSDERFALPGDSGSVLIGATDKKVIGLLWGGRNRRDPARPWIITRSHGLIDPIDIVEAEMGCEVITHDPGNPTQTVDDDNLEGVPHIDEEGKPVVESLSNAERAAGILQRLRERDNGERLAAAAQRAAREVIDLLHASDRVRATWLIHGGPTLAGAFLRGLETPEQRLPTQVREIPIEQCAGRILRELSRAGSAELRSELGLLMPLLDGTPGRTFEDVLRGLETSL